MDTAFDRYFKLSPLLNSDVEYLLRNENQNQSFRRNFIRSACALIEGYLSCFRHLCEIGVESGQGTLTNKEFRALTEEKSLDSANRTKFTLRATYKLFELESIPEFGGKGWDDAQVLLRKRDNLVHPKRAEELEIDDESWNRIYAGAIWIFEPLLTFVEKLARKHGT